MRSQQLAALLAVAAAVTSTAMAAPPKPLKVLIVTGGCCHDYPVQREILKKGLEQRAYLDVETVYQGGTATSSRIPLYENENWSEGFDLVIHDECFSDVKDTAWTERILKPHRDGLPGMVLHCAMHCYRDGTDEWFKFCGVTSRRHGAHYPHEVLTRDGEHPIMQGLGAGWANPAGELYWIEKVWPTAHPLAASKNQEKGNEEVCVWTNEFGDKKTRIFGTTLGHHNVTVEHPMYLDLVTRGALWACGKLNDDYLKPKVAQRVPVNLAKDKTATASSEETGKNNFAKNAVDGKDSTRWCANGANAGQWLQIDLGEPKDVTGCGLKWESDSAIYKYTLETSTDGKEWKTAADRTKADKHYPEERFTAPQTRFIKVTYLGSSTGSWASLWELSVYGTETIEVSPVNARQEQEAAFLSDVKVPAGFEATLFAAPPAVVYPVYVAAAPEGTVYVSVDKNGSLDRKPRRGAIYRLRDINGDGRADETKLFVSDVDSPRGLVWDRDRLYVMHPPHLSAFIDKDGDGVSDEQQILVKNLAFGFQDRPADHTTNGVSLGIDGWLYIACGDFGFMEAEGTDGRKLQFRGGGVVRVRPDGSGMEIYSRGTRNILEVALDPLLNGFTRDNTNDGDGWDIRLHHFTGLEHHGYPSYYKNFNDEAVQPLADYGGGSGCGAAFIDEPGLPAGCSPALYTADWGRNWIYRHRLTANGATFKPDQSEFLGSTRVTDLDIDALSQIFVTSWKGATFTYAGEEVGYLVRLTPKGYIAPALPDFAKLTPEQLVPWLKSDSHRRRLAAQRELLTRQWTPATTAAVQDIAADGSAPLPTRVAALFGLKQKLGAESHQILAKLAADPQLCPFVIRATTDRWDQLTKVPVDLVKLGLTDPNPRTRLEAAVACGRLGDDKLAAPLTKLLADSDPVIAHTAIAALVRLEAAEACFAVIDDVSSSPAKVTGALRVLQSLHEPAVVSGLTERLAAAKSPGTRLAMFTALCRLYQQEGPWKGNSWGTRPDTTGPYFQPETWAESPRIAEVLKRELGDADAASASELLTQLNRHQVRLDGTLDRLIEMAKTDPKLVPIAVRELSRGSTIPAGALPLLLAALSDANADHAVRMSAAQALLKSRDESAFAAVLEIAPQLQGKRDLKPLWDVYLKSDELSPRIELLTQRASQAGSPSALWAAAGLLAVASPKSAASPEAKSLAQRAVDLAGMNPTGRRLLLDAARASNQREFADLVQRGISDDDQTVAELARDIAKQWKLELSPTPRGPKLSTMSAEQAIEAVLKVPGKAGPGEALFAKLNCAKCHTVQPNEPLRGPFLPAVAKTYKRQQLAEAVVLPSKSLAQGFVTNVFLMDDGRSLTGFVTGEAADIVTIRDAEGREIKLPVKEIEERSKQAISVMPEGLAKDLTVDEFAALLAYLESLATK